ERERVLRDEETDWLRALTGRPHPEPVVEWRRGFVDTLGVPAQWLVAHGDEFRARYPLLRRLVLFRLNGWGKQVAKCPALASLPELELACWYGDDDARVLARSPHLGDLRRLVVWSGGSDRQAGIFARGRAWPGLSDLHLIHYFGRSDGWVETVNRAA